MEEGDCIDALFRRLRVPVGGVLIRRGLVLVPVSGTLFLMQVLFSMNVLSRITTFSDGCLGSNNDEGRSEV